MSLPLRRHLDQKLAAFRTDRYSWWTHWRDLADYILPRRYRWLITPNQTNRGSQINQRIIDSTGTIAARTCAAGMMAGITSPTRPWFKLNIEGFANDESHPVSIWLSECERRMLRVFAESNFYNAMAVVYFDLVVFGTGVVIIYEDFEDVIRCFNPCAGEYFLANSDRGNVNQLAREFTQTIAQVDQWFGDENLPEDLKQTLKADFGSQAASREVVVGHLVEPNDGRLGTVAKSFKFREFYWLVGYGAEEKVLRQTGFNEFPALCPRWDLVSNDPYGRSPGMDALPDIKQLQQETKRKAQAIDKMVNPPMVADVELKNQPASMLPGGVTYVARKEGIGFKPAYEVQPRIQELMLDIQEIQNRIQRIFFNDLFMMFQQLQAEPRSAAAVDARREEKLIMLGPVIERFENEALDPAIERTFNIMLRAQLLPPPPEEIQGQTIEVSYVSMLAEAQRAVGSAGIERLAAFTGNLAAAVPGALDAINWDEAIAEYGSQLAVSPKIIRAREEVAQIRKDRAAKEAQAEQMTMAKEAVDGAKVLSETELGPGINALGAALGNQIPA